MVVLSVYLLVALVFSFVCSVLEAVLLSITPTYVAAQRQRTGAFGLRLAALKEDIDRPLAAILTLNTFAHTLGAAGVGAQAQRIWGEESLSIVSGLVTIVILIGSEIIPKTIGAVYWQRLVRPTELTLRVLMLILAPFIWLSGLITSMLGSGKRSLLSRTDITQVVEVGYRDGVLRRSEKAIIANLMRMAPLIVARIMTPRDRILASPGDRNLDSISQGDPRFHTSRIPLYDGQLDRRLGYVLKDECIARRLAGDGELELRVLQRAMPSIAADASIAELYDSLVQTNEHIAWVVDERGGTAGIVTMEDLIEAILGVDIVDEVDRVVERQRLEQDEAVSDPPAPGPARADS